MILPLNTPATGTDEFHINDDGNLCYQVRVNNINGVLGTHIGTKMELSLQTSSINMQ